MSKQVKIVLEKSPLTELKTVAVRLRPEKMSNFRNEDRSYQVENAGYAEFERVSKTQQFFDIFLASSWAWALFENVSYKMFCKNVNIRVQTSQLYAIQGLIWIM